MVLLIKLVPRIKMNYQKLVKAISSVQKELLHALILIRRCCQESMRLIQYKEYIHIDRNN